MKGKRDLAHRLAGFRACVEDHEHSSYFLEEVDGSHRRWKELSAEAKLEYLARDAALYAVPFDAFAHAVRETLTDSPAASEEAALRLVLRSVHELHGLEMLFSDDGRTEPSPLIERFRDALGKQSLADLKRTSERQNDRAQAKAHEVER